MFIPKPNAKIGDYTFLSKLGAGTSSEVWKAEKGGTYFAIKLYNSGLGSQAEEEFRQMEKIKHPNIIDEYEIGTYRKRDYLIMDFLEGPSMNNADWQDYSMKDIEQMAIDLADALQHIHDQKIYHKDLKPANIIIGPNNKVKVLDFGTSTTISYNPHNSFVAGSPVYMAPEQLSGETNSQNDIWGYGVTLYQFLTGEHPYASSSSKDLITNMLSLEVGFPHHKNPKILSKLSYVIMKCLRKNTSERYKTFSEVLQDLTGNPLKQAKRRLFWRNVQIWGFSLAILPVIVLLVYLCIELFINVWTLFILFVIYTLYSIARDAKRKMILSDFIKAGSVVGEYTFDYWMAWLNQKKEKRQREIDEYLIFWNLKNNPDDLGNQSKQLAESLLKTNSRNIPALSFLLYWHYRKNELEQAHTYGQQLLALNSRDASSVFLKEVLNKGGISAGNLIQTDELDKTIKRANASDSSSIDSLDELSKLIVEQGGVSIPAELIHCNFQDLFVYEENFRKTIKKQTRLKVWLIFSRENMEIRLQEEEDKVVEKLVKEVPRPGKISYSDIHHVAFNGKILSIRDHGWYTFRFDPAENVLIDMLGTFLHTVVPPFPEKSTETAKVISEANAVKQKKKKHAIRKLASMIGIGIAVPLLILVLPEDLRWFIFFIFLVIGFIGLIAYPTPPFFWINAVYLLRSIITGFFIKIIRPKVWYKQSLYNQQDYPKLLKTILTSNPVQADSTIDIPASLPKLLQAAPLAIDHVQKKLTYQGNTIAFDTISRIKITHSTITIFQGGKKRFSFRYKNTDYEQYLPVLRQYFENQMELT